MTIKKRVQVEHDERPIDNFVQVFISPQVAAIVHSNYQQVALAFIYVWYICTLSKAQVPGALHVAQFPLCAQCQSCTITSEPSKSEKQTLLANSTAFV